MAVTTSFRVSAFIRLCNMSGEAAYVLKRGDETAGAVLVKHMRSDGTAAVYARRYGMDGGIVWERATGDMPVPVAQADDYIGRRVKSDSDLWVIEVDSKAETLTLTEL